MYEACADDPDRVSLRQTGSVSAAGFGAFMGPAIELFVVSFMKGGAVKGNQHMDSLLAAALENKDELLHGGDQPLLPRIVDFTPPPGMGLGKTDDEDGGEADEEEADANQGKSWWRPWG